MVRTTPDAIETRIGKSDHPWSPQAIIAAGWQTIGGLLDNRDIPPVEAQVEFFGEQFNRRVEEVMTENEPVAIQQQRRVRIVAGWGNGKSGFRPAHDSHVTPSDLKHISINEARISRQRIVVYDAADDASPTLETVRSHGASQSGVDIDYLTIENGGNPTDKMKKPPQSFLFGNTPEALTRHTKRKSAF